MTCELSLIELLPLTLHFLKNLLNDKRFLNSISSSSFVEKDESYILNSLLTALELDGNNHDCNPDQNLPPNISSLFSSSLFSKIQRINVFDKQWKSIDLGGCFTVNLVMIFVCIIFAALASGLTQGLLSLNFTEVAIKARSGTPSEKKYANTVIPIISRHHLLIVTLMLWNASATEALPIFLSGLVPEYLAVIISVTLVLFFGEIIPAAILTGPNRLMITATLAPLVYAVTVIFFIVAYPISLVLDSALGHEKGITVYNRKEISTMMTIQQEEGRGRRGSLNLEEMSIIDGALKFRDMLVENAMTFSRQVFMLPCNERLTYKVLSEIFKSGYSRIPIFGKDRSDIIGLILAKDLIFIDPDDEIPIMKYLQLFGRQPLVVWKDQLLGDILTMFKKGRSHLAIVRSVKSIGLSDPISEVVGIITMEDIMEEILGEEIEDETDYNDCCNQFNSKGTGDLERRRKRDLDYARLELLGEGKPLSEEEVKEGKDVLENNDKKNYLPSDLENQIQERNKKNNIGVQYPPDKFIGQYGSIPTDLPHPSSSQKSESKRSHNH